MNASTANSYGEGAPSPAPLIPQARTAFEPHKCTLIHLILLRVHHYPAPLQVDELLYLTMAPRQSRIQQTNSTSLGGVMKSKSARKSIPNFIKKAALQAALAM